VGQNVARPVAAIVAGFLNDSETIHRTGMSTRRIVTMFAVIQPDFCLVVAAMSGHLPPVAEPGTAAPKSLMKMKAMIATEMKIRMEIADPMPRFSARNRLSYPRIDTE